MNFIRQALQTTAELLNLNASSYEQIFEVALTELAARGKIDGSQKDAIKEALLEHEQIAPSLIGHQTAVPHFYFDGAKESIILFIRLKKPIKVQRNRRVRFIYLLLGPHSAAEEHLDTIPEITRFMSDDSVSRELELAESQSDVLEILNAYIASESESAPPPSDDAFHYSGKFGGGLIADIKRRLPHYKDDIIEGLSSKSVASVFFLFFACLAPAVTFGGVMASLTGGAIGAVEMIVATAFCGIVYAICSGQPLIILGGTGPLLVFTGILYSLCLDFSVPFLPVYAWVGIWVGVLSLILALTDASCLMKYFTRFTDEIFAALISVIYIYEACKALIYIFQNLEAEYHHDTALLSLLLALGTYVIANNLRRFRKSRYLVPQMREFLADFGPSIALVSMTLFAFLLHGVYLDVLNVPESFGTTSGRNWTVDPFQAPVWTWFATIIPATLATVLVFLDQNITARIINSPDHKLVKGHAYHLDVAVVGILIAICSLFGLPWLVAATVRSINHVQSLATVKEVVTPGGERRDQIINVRENRITGFSIHLLVGLSLLLLPLLKVVPMAVLYGLFLYMGIVSMKGNQFFERLSLWTMEPRLYPATHYVRNVPLSVIHRFTLIQLLGLAVLWVVKASAIGILFPLFIALLAPVRFMLNRYFDPDHLEALDSEEAPHEEEERQIE